ncbi:energy-coupling factor transporter transmembrane component T [Cohnella lubricantis]|uniref:Energy-coupling factor transporter transmembrane protein EcfT n=1 Tax=Cohnella lubricantis TaxID=2163172 RepID=A0A841TGY5_9BACL|nr:energy-coupling factor transporter transmembrane component T [Cohnella lubricantis]MBB6679189.1 energy-coupling factor transporter transmembrane protein EcfT [Cohnella lubricantis]MBP2120672.1 energy-coupling factor transport system permease protein [Cohnella lubricantis]
MRARIVVGRYIETGSWVHSLDPRAKTTAVLLFMAAVFMTDSYAGIAVLLLFSLIYMKAAAIPLSMFARAIKPLLLIILFIFVFHLLFTAGGSPIVDLGLFKLYAGGLQRGLVAASRMVLFVAFAALASFTTRPERLTQALGLLLKPLRYVGGSPDRMALMVSVSMRFIPTIFEEAERIWNAQVSRGLELRGRPMRQQARLILSLLVPVTAGAFRRALDLSESMEARGYRLGAPRSAYRRLTWQGKDTWFIVSFFPLLAAVWWL